jgi:hypothetical protein
VADECDPVIAVDGDNKLYVVWQDNRGGDWDVYISTSTDGTNWSAERPVVDANDNQTNPAVVVDGAFGANVYVVWQDDRNGNNDIYMAVSNNGFTTGAVSQITFDGSQQLEPAAAVASDGTVYVVWTDTRGGTKDIYGAASNVGPWQNVAIITNSGNQSGPAIGVETVGHILHFLWVDDASGNRDICYATSNGLPVGALPGSSIIDDSSGADQLGPAIAVVGSTGSDLRVFACWQDERNISADGGDTDLYFTKVNSDGRANVFVGDDGVNSDQSRVAIATDLLGNPYPFWTDNRSGVTDIYYAGATSISLAPVSSEFITATDGGTVGPAFEEIATEDDVSVTVPADAYSSDITISVLPVQNPPTVLGDSITAGYEFSPSGLEFSTPVTVIIPYEVSGPDTVAPLAYWYDPLTGTLSQEGITNVEIITISASLRAVRFQTTHFTQFFIGENEIGNIISFGGGGGGGGGGCSVSGSGHGNIVEFAMPYIALAVVIAMLKRRDAVRRNRRNFMQSRS